MSRPQIAILGAGPAGLGAAYRLARRNAMEVIVLERGSAVGGNAGSFELAGLSVDYGSHRLHPSCAPEILADIRRMLSEDLLDRPRHGRIRLRGRWVHFPLQPADVALHLPRSFLLGAAIDTVTKSLRRSDGSTFASVLRKGLGSTICRDFYFPYAWKIWGADPDTLDAEQARRRVSAGSVSKMARKLLNAVPGIRRPGAGRFYYPRRGYGAISEAYRDAGVSQGARFKLGCRVTALDASDGRLCAVKTEAPDGNEVFRARQVLSTIPISQLVKLIEPQAPEVVLASACSLKFRSMILVYLVLETDQFTEYDAHYFPDPEVAITRLSEPKNYGLASLPGRTVLCAELPCSTEDPVWRASDAQLARLVMDALGVAGIPVKCALLQVAVRKLAQAYPIYRTGYAADFDRMDRWIAKIEGLVTFGRQGLFAHDNTHHALAMAYALDGCIGDDGSFDTQRWAERRREFRQHVVED